MTLKQTRRSAWSTLAVERSVLSLRAQMQFLIDNLQYYLQVYYTKYYITLFKVPHHPLQSTTPPSSMYHTTIFKVPHHPLQSTTSPSSKYHTTIFKVSYHPLQSYYVFNGRGCCLYRLCIYIVLHYSNILAHVGLIVSQVDVLEVQYAALLASLQRSSDFEAIGFAHDCYLNNMVKDCFLLSKVLL